MLSVQPAPNSSPRNQQPKLEEDISDIISGPIEEAKLPAPKSKCFGGMNILIMIAIVALLAVGAVVILDLTKEKDMKSGIDTTHNKIREHAGSSKKEGSSTGS